MSSNREITEFRIYPAIGIARVGNSPDEYFFGPEVPGPHPHDPSNFRDAQGRIKRQAARFRVYGFDRHGEVVREMTQDDETEIRWTVQVANTKSAWFDFDLAMDIPAAANIASNRRNPGIDRDLLEIKPEAIQIHGCNTNAGGGDSDFAFDDGTYGPHRENVYLGEVRTDADGRLIFLGGRGLSQNPWGHAATTFANNLGFHDDVSDGWVEARITYKGQQVDNVLGAWVVTAPPNFAPGIQGIVTGYDLLYDLACTTHPEMRVETPRFSEEIWPLLRRLPQHQWVNAGFARDFGLGSAHDWANPETRRSLGDNDSRTMALRNAVFNLFRPADYAFPLSNAVPGYYGDAMSTDTSSTDPMGWMAITRTQYRWLEQWAAGHFIADGGDSAGTPLTDNEFAFACSTEGPPQSFDALTPAEQVRGIDRAVLDETLGGPFHPGAEFTWPMRQAIMYSQPFRIKRRTAAPDDSPQLTQSSALAAGGPLDGSLPGSISRWMAVPWQTDTSSCLSAYLPFIDDYLPTFWPARVPNDVLTEEQLRKLLEPGGSISDVMDAFNYQKRPKWLRGIRYPQGIAFPQQVNSKLVGVNRFIHKWSEVGIVTEFWQNDKPSGVWVETGRTLDHDPEEESRPIREENPRALFQKD